MVSEQELNAIESTNTLSGGSVRHVFPDVGEGRLMVQRHPAQCARCDATMPRGSVSFMYVIDKPRPGVFLFEQWCLLCRPKPPTEEELLRWEETRRLQREPWD